MPRVSKIPVERATLQELNDSFVTLLAGFREKSDVKDFIEDFLTEEERIMLSKRLMVGLMIRQGYNYEQIRRILKISPTTINQMKHWLEYKPGIAKGIKVLEEEERMKKFRVRLQNLVKNLPPLTRDMKARARWLNR